jgi:hypothetical protein
MKRIFTLLLAVFLAVPLLSFGAGTCTQNVTGTMDSITRQIITQQLTSVCTGDSGNGVFPATAINSANLTKLQGWYLYQAQTKPGTTAPTALYDITLIDANGYDIMGGLLNNRSATLAETVLAGFAAAGYPIVSPSGFTITPTGNSVASGSFTLVLTFVK